MPDTQKPIEDTTKQVQTLWLKDINGILSDAVGERYADYRRRWDAATAFQHCGKYPIHIDLELNYGCNLRCRMCLFSLPKSRRKNEPKQKLLDLDRVKTIIRDGIPHGLASLGTSFYNEPLLRKDIFDFCSWARSEGIVDIIMATNGTLLTEAMSERVIDSGVTKLRFSLDAFSKDVYEKIRVGAHFEKTMGNIHNFLRIRNAKGVDIPVVSVNFVLMKENEHELEAFKAYWSKYVDFIVIQNLVRLDDTDTQFSDYKALAQDFRCPQPWQRLIIRSDGTVLPCTYHEAHSMSLGNIYRDSVYDMWNSAFMNTLRSTHKAGLYRQIETCKACASKSTCG